MTRKFEIDLYDRHLIIKEGGNVVLIDTGNPVSLTDRENFDFMGVSYPGCRSIGDKGIGVVSEQLGRKIDILVGLDVLNNYIINIDYANRLLEIADEPFEKDGSVVSMHKGRMGVLTIPMSVDGKVLNFALDTGAKISYVNRKVTANDSCVKYLEDFNPLFGYFSTPIFNKTVGVGDQVFQCEFGNLPNMAELSLSMLGIDGVIGYDLFNTFNVTLDFLNNKCILN